MNRATQYPTKEEAEIPFGASASFVFVLRKRFAFRASLLEAGRERAQLLECGVDDRLRFALNHLEMIGPDKAFGVNLIEVFRARRARREPAILRHDFEPTDRSRVARSHCQFCLNGFPRKLGRCNLIGGKRMCVPGEGEKHRGRQGGVGAHATEHQAGPEISFARPRSEPADSLRQLHLQRLSRRSTEKSVGRRPEE